MRGETDSSVSVHIPVTASSYTLYADGCQPRFKSKEMTLDINPRVPAFEYDAPLRAILSEAWAVDHASITLNWLPVERKLRKVENHAVIVSCMIRACGEPYLP